MVENQLELSDDRVLVVCELLFRVELLDGLSQFLVILVLDLGNLFLHHLQLRGGHLGRVIIRLG